MLEQRGGELGGKSMHGNNEAHVRISNNEAQVRIICPTRGK